MDAETAAGSICQTDSIPNWSNEPSLRQAHRSANGGDESKGDEPVEDERVDVSYSDLIAQLEKLEPDDDETNDIDAGISVETLNDINSDDSDLSETLFDIELRFPESAETDSAEEATTVDNLGFEAVELPRSQDGDDGELPLDPMLESSLPPMDADASDELGEPTAVEIEIGREQGDIAWSERRYVEAPGRYGKGPYYVLVEHRQAIYAAGKTVLKISNDAPFANEASEKIVTLAELEHSALGLIAIDDERLFSVTTPGHLTLVHQSEAPRKLKHHLASVSRPSGLAVSQLALHGDALRLLLSDGSVVRSDDGGSTFHAEPTDAPLLRLASGSTLLGLTRDRDQPLATLRDGAWRSVVTASPKPLLASLDASFALFAAVGNVVLLGERERGIWLSLDSGAHFEFLAGSSGVTAVWVGYATNEPTAFLATTRAVEGSTTVLQLDLTSRKLTRALEINLQAALPSSSERDDDESLHALLYQPETQTLWLAGTFGLKRFTCEPVQ
jgi:hypothetical protein